MALSGVISGVYTVQQTVDKALRVVGVLGEGEASTGDQFSDALMTLNGMCKTWSMHGPNLWARADGTVTLVSGTATYTLDPRPRTVQNVRFAVDGVERRPLTEMMRNDFDASPIKTQTGDPVLYILDRQRTSTTLTFWPTPTFSSGAQTAPYSYERVWQDATAAAEDLDIPQEWFEMVWVNLAARLADEYRIETPSVERIRQRAATLYDVAMNFDRHGDVRLEVSF